jgi:hypothetical protein
MEESVRQLVRERAGNRCEYCRVPQRFGTTIRFHVEHIRPRQHGGNDEAENLALACPTCNWNKGPNMSSVDPKTDRPTSLFNPRIDLWKEHFALVGFEIVGLTIVGRATVRLLRMNNPEYVEVRRELDALGELNIDD